jgi:subtilisin family serine protease
MSLPADDLFAQQWHLHNTVAGQFDLDVVKVWDEFTGKGIKVMVMDNGFDHEHVDLKPNYDFADSYDYGAGDDDAAPDDDADNHGTAVMGIIGAARNGVGVVGVAYDATLIGASISYDVDADAWATNFDNALGDAVTEGVGVINMSFGGSGSFDSYDGTTNVAAMQAAMGAAVADGRDGLGIVLVKSAGNARQDPFSDNDGLPIDVNHNSTDSDTRQIIVAAVNRDGYVSEYSSYGAPVLISAFGSPLAGEIVTTDRTGAAGYNTDPSDPGFTLDFNGTSAAAPMISGVVALMLEANPDLGWRDVQDILAYSAHHVGSPVDGMTLHDSEMNLWNFNKADNWNGGGLHYSQDYGYGLVDTLAAVRLAESWQDQSTSKTEKSAVLHMLDSTIDPAVAIPDSNSTGSPVSGTTNKALDIERVVVDLTLSAGNAKDIQVLVTSPDGIEQRLMSGQRSFFTSFNGTLHLNCQAFRGENSQGEWSVRVVDALSGNALSVSDLVVTVYGSAPSKDDTYVYTNEFSDFTADKSHSKNLKDTDGGTDTLNAAAVSSSSSIDLSKGTGKIDGVTMQIKGIEDVFSGDGNDRLTGNGAANALSGGRGKDVLAGGKGGDSFIYHVVTDSLAGKKHDLIKDFTKGDHIDLSGIDTSDTAGDQGFRFLGSNHLDGKHPAELDFDVIDKKGSAHDATMVFADLDGDKHADFQIELSGLHTLAKGDFIL